MQDNNMINLNKKRKEQEQQQRPSGPGYVEDKPAQSAGPPEIGQTEIEKLSVLGDGSFGTVYQGRCRSKDVAVKVLHKQDLDEKTLHAFRKEVEIMSKIYHPNIVLFMGACTIPGHMCIVTELLPRGDLESMLQQKEKPMSLLMRLRMAKDASLGMTWLHSSNPVFIHRDLKTANLLVDANMNVKVCDFGLSQIKKRGENIRDGTDGAKGTPLWMAPEVMLGQTFNEKADIYSFGIVLWEIITREEPFQEFDNFEEFRTAICIHHKRPPIPDSTSPKLKQLIEACWHPNPNNRPSFKEIVELLDDVIIDIAIEGDAYGRKFWSDCFGKRDTVKWNDFKRAFHELLDWSDQNFGKKDEPLPPIAAPEHLAWATSPQLEEYSRRSPQHHKQVQDEFMRRQSEGLPIDIQPGSPQLNFECLRAVVASVNGGDEVVTMEQFGKVLFWFGPLVVPKRGVIILDTIRNILKKPWFHGDISTKEAEWKLVAANRPGTFLIRFSTSAGSSYTISKVNRDGLINHQRFSYVPNNGFVIEGRAYRDLDHLIQGEKTELGLYQACVGNKYTQLFNAEKVSGYILNATPM